MKLTNTGTALAAGRWCKPARRVSTALAVLVASAAGAGLFGPSADELRERLALVRYGDSKGVVLSVMRDPPSATAQGGLLGVSKERLLWRSGAWHGEVILLHNFVIAKRHGDASLMSTPNERTSP